MRIIKNILIGILALAAVLVLGLYLFMQQKSFGTAPSGKRLERIQQSPNYKDGQFINLDETPMMAKGVTYPDLLYKYFTKSKDTEPAQPLPSIRTNLLNLGDQPVIVWFGHSTYLISIDGKNILVDPVFSERASPVQYMGPKEYAFTNSYSVNDLPPLDLVIISHDHYDHLDYNTIKAIQSKTKAFCVGLGIGAHLEYWGVKPEAIHELDWWEGEDILPGLRITSTPARHFSGRGIKRYQTLWSSFVLEVGGKKIFVGGDSGYSSVFSTIGEKFGPFDIVMLECGQYNSSWPNIHMTPEQTIQAGIDLKSAALMPVHWGKFTLSLHPWNEPADRALAAAEKQQVNLITPLMGDPLSLDTLRADNRWWKELK